MVERVLPAGAEAGAGDAGVPAPGTGTCAGPVPARPVGRPRDAEIEAKVLAAAQDLIRGHPEGREFTIGQLVERSGVSRAAIYRRWGSRRDIVVAALDADRAPVVAQVRGTLLETLQATLLDAMDAPSQRSLGLVNQRIIMGLRDPKLQRDYWERHVNRRRSVTRDLLEEAKAKGEIRADTDVDVVIDMVNGTAYYQGVVRGDWNSPAARARVMAAVELAYRAIAVPPEG